MRTTFQLAAILLASVFGSAAAQEPMPSVANPPAVIKTMKAQDVIEQVLAQQHELLLSPAQAREFTALHEAVKDGRVIYESTGRTKPPFHRATWIKTPEQALAKAYTLLDPQQQHKSLMLFGHQRQRPN